jgi:hypothetical protein
MVDEYGVVGVGWIWRSVEVTGSGKWALGLCFPEVMGRCLSCSQCRKREVWSDGDCPGLCNFARGGRILGILRLDTAKRRYLLVSNETAPQRLKGYLPTVCEAPAKDSNTKWNGREQWRGPSILRVGCQRQSPVSAEFVKRDSSGGLEMEMQFCKTKQHQAEQFVRCCLCLMEKKRCESEREQDRGCG